MTQGTQVHSRRSFRRMVLAGGFAVLLAVAGSTILANSATTTEWERASGWAETHLLAADVSIEDLAAYPVAYRVEAFKRLPPESRSRLWREHLQRFLARERSLTDDQRAFVRQAMEIASPSNFALPEELIEPVRLDLCKKLRTLFRDGRLREDFRNLGNGVTPSFITRGRLTATLETLRSQFNLNASLVDCNCYGEGWCECDWDEECVGTGCNSTGNCGCIFPGGCSQTCRKQMDGR